MRRYHSCECTWVAWILMRFCVRVVGEDFSDCGGSRHGRSRTRTSHSAKSAGFRARSCEDSVMKRKGALPKHRTVQGTTERRWLEYRGLSRGRSEAFGLAFAEREGSVCGCRRLRRTGRRCSGGRRGCCGERDGARCLVARWDGRRAGCCGAGAMMERRRRGAGGDARLAGGLAAAGVSEGGAEPRFFRGAGLSFDERAFEG